MKLKSKHAILPIYTNKFIYPNFMQTLLSPGLILSIVAVYFLLLMGIAYLTGRNADNSDFFVANKQAPWYLVAFGMIGASLSGVTFISVPGMVGAVYLNADLVSPSNMEFSYMQVVLGYMVGYFVIASLLLPLYYRLQLTSIYTYLEKRFGAASYKTGAAFFLVSRIIGASFRLYLVAMVLYLFVFEPWAVPFWVVALLTIVLIWIYTFKGGIKTIVWTDTLQTTFMLIAVVMTIKELTQALGFPLADAWSSIESEGLGQLFFFENGWSDANNFFKQFISGVFIAIVMTGLDQDMMQKNLTCRSLKDAQKNMFSFSIVLLFVNFIFLMMGALLAIYALRNGVSFDRSDSLYPTIALQHLSVEVGVVFIIGLVAAAYSSADSALTALTTSFCIDFLGFKTNKDKQVVEQLGDPKLLDDASAVQTDSTVKTRYMVHVGFSLVLFAVIVAFWLINDQSVIVALFKIAGYTYGPLLGLYSFGLFTKLRVKDQLVPIVCLCAPLVTYLINANSSWLLMGYQFGFELLLVNGLLTFIGLMMIRDGKEAMPAI